MNHRLFSKSPHPWRVMVTLFSTTTLHHMAEPRAMADASSPTLIVYSHNGNNQPRSRTWNGSSWSAATTMPSIGSTANWVVLKNCPTREETACATLDQNKLIKLLFYKNGAWGSVSTVCSDTDIAWERAFDMCYESKTGDMLIVYWDKSANAVCYRTYNGTTLSSAANVATTSGNAARWIKLVAKPTSNEILLLRLHNNRDLYVNVFNGSTWITQLQLSTNAMTSSYECFAGAYSAASGLGVIAWSVDNSNNLKYRTWNGSTFSSEASTTSIGAKAQWVRMAADGASDDVLCMTSDDSNDLNVIRWTGSGWTSANKLCATLTATDRRCFDLAYEPQGVRALALYAQSGNQYPKFHTFEAGAWSTPYTGSNTSNPAQVVALQHADTGSVIFQADGDDGEDLNARVWFGSSLSNHVELYGTIAGSKKTESFMISTPVSPPLTPAGIPYSHDFETAMGDEWSNDTRTSNATLTQFAGRHRTNSLTLALLTTPGMTYSVVFDFYAIDSWDGTDTSENYYYGPDWFTITANGSQIFRHTFVHEWPVQGMTYPYPYDQMGDYGFVSGWKDAIYRKVEATFTATDAVTRLSFVGEFNGAMTGDDPNGFDDESWGIDNISVKTARFIDVSSARGFAVQNCSNEDLYGGGLHWADLDKDGDLDCIMTGDSARYLKNNNAGQSFVSASFPFPDHRRQAALIDIDNDGDLDLWTPALFSYDNESCAENDGAGVFSHPGNLGFSSATNNEACAAADLNHDGYCDLVMFSQNGNWHILRQPGSVVVVSGSNSASNGMNEAGDVGNGDFCSSGDVNNDGFLDFFYHFNSGKLFLSKGDGTFTRNNHGISVVTGETLKFGSAWADYDNDGDLDLFAARMSEGCTGYLWRNDRNWTDQTGAFTNVTASAGFNLNTVIDYTEPDLLGTRSVAWGDYDNDGFLDLLLVGASGNLYLYRNLGNGSFTRSGEGLVANNNFADGVFVDYDNDGDLDIALTRVGANAMLFENQTNNSNYLKVRVIGRGEGGSNVAAIGTRVDLCDSSGNVVLARRDVGLARGYAGSEPHWLHFGGINPNASYKLKVYFLSRAYADPLVVSVMPANVSTTIGSRTISQMITVSEPNKSKIIHWREVRNAAN